jgi:hypothetical protein
MVVSFVTISNRVPLLAATSLFSVGSEAFKFQTVALSSGTFH